MADNLSSEKRHKVMASIGSKDTLPERMVCQFLFSRGLRFRLHCRNLPGTPDLVIPRFNSVVFVDGCFWHGHEGCKYFRFPRTRSMYWRTKILHNRERDSKVGTLLSGAGWKVFRVWECAITAPEQMARTLERLYIGIINYRLPLDQK